jgi:hypothetical protein
MLTCDNCGKEIPVGEDGTPKKGIIGGELDDGVIVCSSQCYDDYIEHDGIPKADREES